MSFEKISQVLDSGSREEKISVLESLIDVTEPQIISKIISKLDDPDIEVRGEAFSTLVLNENKIDELLIKSLDSENKNIRGFSALILANRNDVNAIPPIIKLTNDQSSMVRSCALGALGYLKAQQASKAIQSCFSDSNIEVKKSALKAAIDIGYKIPENKIDELEKENDEELSKLLIQAKRL